MSASQGQRNQVVDALRAVAALWVCLYHFTGGVGIGAFGYLGVTVFFVISGFIVPYSMLQGGYALEFRWEPLCAEPAPGT